MATDINIRSLFPALENPRAATLDVFNTTFIGIDFGTSTTVVSVATVDKAKKEIKTEPIWLDQDLEDGASMSSEKIPTVIAWYKERPLVGQGAANLKYQLKKGVNVWYSFKMELGVDVGPTYYNSELDRNSAFPILYPRDAAKVFFRYLKARIDRHVRENKLPPNVQYAVSIPASFEANQRKELIQALEQNGISINKQSLIDEPNAAFLSYVQFSSAENNPLAIPDGYNPKILVFDFGAGTCDVSILELGKDLKGIYSKNLSISKFEKIGGDNIDRLIATEHLFPQMLNENGRKKEDFRTAEKKHIITRLLKTAEQLKILICENIALQANNRTLPATATSKAYVSLGNSIKIDTRKGYLTLTEPRLSYAEFSEVMKVFLKSTNSLMPYRTEIVEDEDYEFGAIFSPVQSALKKASLSKDEIDYVLLIGGSCKNPYVQAALKAYFNESDLVVPRDLQTHVSAGAAIHSLVYNGFGKNIIQPITSEPLIVITKDETPKVIMRAGTHIPCDLIVIDDLATSRDGQKAVELPICVGSVNKLLYNIQIVSPDQQGFKRGTPVKLEMEITTDKLLVARATVAGQQVMPDSLNPFANKELTTEQRIVLQAERQVNIEAEQNGGKPTRQGLEKLYRAYEKTGNDLKAAETLEDLNELYPSVRNFNEIGVLYSRAGYDEKALKYYEKGYKANKNAVTAFNYAYKLRDRDRSKFREILEESLLLDPDSPHSLYELGRLLKEKNDPKGKKMIEKAFETWKRKFEMDQMSKNEYGWLASAADELEMWEFARQVRDSEPRFGGDKLYDSENLTVTAQRLIVG